MSHEIKTPESQPGLVEHIVDDGQYLATIVRANYLPNKTTFISPDEYYQQLGFVVYPRGGEIRRHKHLPLERSLTGTPETLVVRRGRVKVELYDDQNRLSQTVELGTGDVILLVSGGHGISCLEDTILMEIKQGPYTGLVEKEFF